MKLTILIFSFFFSFFIFSQSEITEENMELDSIHYRCYTVQQTTTSQGKSETITKRICEKRIHEIYSKGKKYIYKASFFDSLGEIISITNITMEGSNKIREGVNSQMIANITYERILNDSSKFQKYIDNNECSIWLTNYENGVIENKDRVFMHPFQNNQFAQTEIAGFPSVSLPLTIDKTWTETTKTADVKLWGNWRNLTIVNKYKVISNKTFTINNELITCYEIECITNFKDKINKHTFLFNEKLGFISMKYEFYNGNMLNFEMFEYSINN